MGTTHRIKNDIEQLCGGRKLKGTVHEIKNQIAKFDAIAIKEENSDKKYIGVAQFRQMLGVLGKY
jgi:hypothetical protein